MITPYLSVSDARAAIDWYVEALGARVLAAPIVMPDGRIGHAELSIGDATFYLADAHPEIGVVAPDPAAGATVSLVLGTDDVDAATELAVTAGARLDRAPTDSDHGRGSVIVDPSGHRWMLQG